ncbi:hypothetical protein ACP70R_015549 [Stipagrostis hirtigluma subsp. patula]
MHPPLTVGHHLDGIRGGPLCQRRRQKATTGRGAERGDALCLAASRFWPGQPTPSSPPFPFSAFKTHSLTIAAALPPHTNSAKNLFLPSSCAVGGAGSAEGRRRRQLALLVADHLV